MLLPTTLYSSLKAHIQLSKTNWVRALSSSSAQILAGTCNDLLGRPYVRFLLPDALKDIPVLAFAVSCR